MSFDNYGHSCNHHPKQDTECLHYFRKFPPAPLHPFLCPPQENNRWLLSPSGSLACSWIPYTRDQMVCGLSYLVFPSAWRLWSIRIECACWALVGGLSFVGESRFTRPPADGHLGWLLHLLWLRLFGWTYLFLSLGWVPETEIILSLGTCKFRIRRNAKQFFKVVVMC